MGGDTIPLLSCSDEESSLDKEFPDQSFISRDLINQDGIEDKLGENSVDGESHLVPGGFGEEGLPVSYSSLQLELRGRRRRRVYKEVLESYDEWKHRIQKLEEAKRKILSYAPGSWIEKVSGMKSTDFNIPKTTSLLLIGPQGSGKSSLVNRISKVFDDDMFASERAQVSYNSTAGEGTYFLQEYIIPRDSTSLCLYDTRALSSEQSENKKLFARWMTKGVRHGELVLRDSDNLSSNTTMKWKARQNNYSSHPFRPVNFVILVVSGLSILESLDSNDEDKRRYGQLIATTFNNPFLSFRDDKPAVVLTHGDLLSLTDRVRVRLYLGELLGIPPKKQIFDIPEIDDLATEVAVVDLLRYCLEHADKNIPGRRWKMSKVPTSQPAVLIILMVLGFAIISAYIYSTYVLDHSPTNHEPSDMNVDWNAVRHLWLGLEYD